MNFHGAGLSYSRAGTHVVDVLSAVVALPWRLCRGVLVRDGVWIDAMRLILVHVLHAGARDQKRSRLLRVVLTSQWIPHGGCDTNAAAAAAAGC